MTQFFRTFVDEVTPLALTAYVQTLILLSLACIVTRVLRRHHAMCHTVCLGAVIGCALCPLLALCLPSSYPAYVWRLKDADSIRGEPAAKHRSTVNRLLESPDTSPHQQRDDSTSIPVPTVNEEVIAEVRTDSESRSAVPDPVPQQHALRKAEPNGNLSANAKTIPREAENPVGDTAIAKLSSGRSAVSTVCRWFVVGWFQTVILLAVRLLLRQHRLKRLLLNSDAVEDEEIRSLVQEIAEQTGTRRIPDLIASTVISLPFVYAVRRPRIVVPRFLTGTSFRNELRNVLTHEMCHLQRGDLWKSLLQRIVQLVFCVNPLIHAIAAWMSRAREEICDNHVLKFTTPTDYCRTLLALAEQVSTSDAEQQPRLVLPMGTFTRMWSTETRVAELLHPSRRMDTRLRMRSKLGVLALLCVTATLAGNVAVIRESTADESRLVAGAPEPSQLGQNVASQPEAEALLSKVLSRAGRWIGPRSESLTSLAYDYELGGRTQKVELVNGVSKVRDSLWNGATLENGLKWLSTERESFDVTLEIPEPEITASGLFDRHVVRLVCRRKESAKSMTVAFGNGIDGRWSGYFSHPLRTVVIDVDAKTGLPLVERLNGTTVTYGHWIQADENHKVPGFVSVRHGRTRWDMHFDWLDGRAWLLADAESGPGNQKAIVARTSNVRINGRSIVREQTERHVRRQESTAPLRRLYKHNRFWLRPELHSESLTFAYHAQREDIRESCFVNDKGYAVFEITHDGKGDQQTLGERKVALPDGSWATGDRFEDFLYLRRSDGERSIPHGQQLRHYALIGCQLDLPLFRLHSITDSIQVTTTPGDWNGTACDVSRITGTGRNAWLGCGTMMAFSSWSYIHHVYPVSTTVYMDRSRNVPLHESIRDRHNREYKIDYLQWQQVEPGQWVPMAITVQSDDYFTCEMKFQLVNTRQWMLSEVTSWFDPASKSRGVVSEIRLNQSSTLWSQAKDQIDATQELFSDAGSQPETNDGSLVQLSSTPVKFGRWVEVDDVKVMLTLSSTDQMQLKIRASEEPNSKSVPILALDRNGRLISSTVANLTPSNGSWQGSFDVSSKDVENVVSIAIASKSGEKTHSLPATSIKMGNAQSINVSDNDKGSTRISEIEVLRSRGSQVNVRLRCVSMLGPSRFPITANVALFSEDQRLIACGEQTVSVLVNGKPYDGNLKINLGEIPAETQIHHAVVSVRNGSATAAPVGSTWATFMSVRDVQVPIEALLASDDSFCHLVAVRRMQNLLTDRKAIQREFFDDLRDRERAVDRKQLRSDLLKPFAEDLVRFIRGGDSAKLRLDAARLLGHSGDTTRHSALLPMLESSDEVACDVAAIALGMLGHDAGFHRIRTILGGTTAKADELLQKRTDGAEQQQTGTLDWRILTEREKDILIALVALNSKEATDLLGQSLMEDLESLSVVTDNSGKRQLEGRWRRASQIMAVSKYANADIVPWLIKAIAFADQHPGIAERLDQSDLANALLAHEEQGKEMLAAQIRRLDMPYIYAIKKSRNPYYVPAVRDMLQDESVDSWMYQKGVEYLWNTGTPAAIELLEEIYHGTGPQDYAARMILCEALADFAEYRGLPEALEVLTESFAAPPDSMDAGVLKDDARLRKRKLRAAERVLGRAPHKALVPVILAHKDTADTQMRRAIIHAMGLIDSLPPAMEANIVMWADSQDASLRSEANALLATYGLAIDQ